MEAERTRPTVAVVGVGAMGEALVAGLSQAGWQSNEVIGFEPNPTRRTELTSRYPFSIYDGFSSVAADQEIVIVVVKPAEVPQLIQQMNGVIQPEQTLLSLAAGIPTRLYEQSLPNIPVIRAMPNTPALISQGATALSPGKLAQDHHLLQAKTVMSAVGIVEILPESQLDAVTAVSGSGPAYLFRLAELLMSTAEELGLSPETANRLVTQTLRGSASLLAQSDLSASQLREQVTSPGGTTASALASLEQSGWGEEFARAVRAACQRSEELGKLA